jgi:hypothetical protein
MLFKDLLKNLKFDYYAEMAAQCQDDQASRLVDAQKAAQFPTFYKYLQQRGINRHQLSAHGIGKDINEG